MSAFSPLHGLRGVIFSLEMNNRQNTNRMIANLAAALRYLFMFSPKCPESILIFGIVGGN
jgi:hypothetical protein